MILIICGTNRRNSLTSTIAKFCFQYIESKGLEAKYLNMEDLPTNFISNEMYEAKNVHEGLIKIQEKYIFPSEKWLVITPEYNGSIPGIFKLFLDAISVKDYNRNFENKKAGLIGVADGRAGNLRGMEHLTGFLNYLKMEVFPEKLPLSQIGLNMDDNTPKEEMSASIRNMVDRFMAW